VEPYGPVQACNGIALPFHSSVNIHIFSNIILSLRKKMQIQHKVAAVQHCATPCSTVQHRATLCNTVASCLVLAFTHRYRSEQAVPNIRPTAAHHLSASAVFHGVSRKPEVTNSNKWRQVRKLKVIRVIKGKDTHQKRLRKTIL
jgi:hypothetical protein